MEDTGIVKETAEAGAETKTVEQQEEPKYTQADLDRAITKAIKTREEKLKEDFDKKALLEQHKYKELFEQSEARAKALQLEKDTTAQLGELQLAEFAPLVASFSTLEERVAKAKALKELVDARINTAVAEKLKTSTPVKTNDATAKPIGTLSNDEWKQKRKEMGIKD